jgi:type I restriction-modification system DNA methylase subunit
MFLVHTYLSVFAKFLAYSVITKKPISDDATITGILNGTIFQTLNIERFVEDDFFHWVAGKSYFKKLRLMFRELNWQLTQYDFTHVQEDILKGLYQELIDLETRHALGEYYTPDWLCERLVDELKITSKSSVLDPACGSGSFLRAVIARMRREHPRLGAEALAEQVVGIDIHPLSVLTAPTWRHSLLISV